MKKPYKYDLSGMTFGRLTVIEYAGKRHNGRTQWRCRCQCGNETVATRSNLVAGKIISCGCKRREQAGNINRVHGECKTRLYSIWRNMITRTENPKGTAYDRYGGRGIRMCPEWRNSFVAFRDWAVSNGYSDALTIDRINTDGNYTPENCRWVPWKTQFNNRSTNVCLTFQGRSQTAAEWARETGISRNAIYMRLRAGWPTERILTTLTKGGVR